MGVFGASCASLGYLLALHMNNVNMHALADVPDVGVASAQIRSKGVLGGEFMSDAKSMAGDSLRWGRGG